MTHSDETGLAPEHKELVATAVPPIPLEESRIRLTLHRARVTYVRRQLIKKVAKIGAPVLFLAFLAAGFWRWSGRDSARELHFGSAIAVTQNPSEYDFEALRAASGRIWTAAKATLTVLVQQGAIPPETKASILDSIDRPQPLDEVYTGHFEELSARVQNGQTLNPEELQQLTSALRAGISAIRLLGTHDPKHADFGKKLCERLRTVVSEAPSGSPSNAALPAPTRIPELDPTKKQVPE